MTYGEDFSLKVHFSSFRKEEFMRTKALIQIFLVASVLLSISLARAQVPPKEILVGGTISLTGRFATMVGPFKKLAESWGSLVNERGGIFVKEYNKKLPVRFIIYDDKSDQATSMKFYEKLVTDDKVHILLGPFGSFLNFASSTVAEKYKIPMLMIEATDRKLYERGYKWSVGFIIIADHEALQYLEMVKKERKVKTIAMICEDTLHATSVMSSSAAIFRESGFDVVLTETLPAETKDFSSLVAKIKSLNPDLVFCEAFPSFEIPFFKQALEMGLRPKEFYGGHVTKPVIDSLGPAANYITSIAFWVAGLKYPGTEDYFEVLKRTGIAWDAYMESAMRFIAYTIVQDVIEKAGSLDSEKLMDALRKQKFTSMTGPISRKPDGSGNLMLYPVQVQDSRFVPIFPPEVAEGKHIFPTPWK